MSESNEEEDSASDKRKRRTAAYPASSFEEALTIANAIQKMRPDSAFDA